MAGGVRDRGCAWQGACVKGGVHDRGCVCGGGDMCGRGSMHGREGCVAGACMAGMHGRGCAWQGMHAPPRGYDEIRSMSGRYASYWNAFL